uniref:Transposase n=1 Tax=Steinernema glaseri TaxID=37863 RepID=A0A1I7YN74_9BILA
MDRMAAVDLQPLGSRRKQIDLATTFKILRGFCRLLPVDYFTLRLRCSRSLETLSHKRFFATRERQYLLEGAQ